MCLICDYFILRPPKSGCVLYSSKYVTTSWIFHMSSNCFDPFGLPSIHGLLKYFEAVQSGLIHSLLETVAL